MKNIDEGEFTMNIFKQLILSLYSPKSISTWRTQGIGKTIFYVFLLTFIAILPTVIHLSMAITSGVQATQETVEGELPNFMIKNGELTADDNAPKTIDKGTFTLLFDPSGQTGVNDLDTSMTSLALLKNDFAITSGGTIQHFSYSMLELEITKEDAVKLLDSMDSFLTVILPILFIVIYLFSSAMKFIGISILALIGTMVHKSGTESLKYRHLWRIAAYSITLPTFFFMIMDIFQTAVPFGFVLNWFVSILVLILAIKEIPQAKDIQ